MTHQNAHNLTTRKNSTSKQWELMEEVTGEIITTTNTQEKIEEKGKNEVKKRGVNFKPRKLNGQYKNPSYYGPKAKCPSKPLDKNGKNNF